MDWDKMEKEIENMVKYYNDMIPMLTVEECGKLIQAIPKLERTTGEKYVQSKNNLIKELANISISMVMLMIYYKIDFDKEVLPRIAEKLN